MLTINVKRNASRVKDYFKDHLDQGEYYSEKGKIIGHWFGKTLNEFGLEPGSDVSHDKYCLLVDGINPKTGKQIPLRMKNNRRVGFDLTLSAPKSLSILAITAQDSRLIDAHHEAVAVAFSEIEKKARTRVRKGLFINAKESRVTGNLVGAHFTHRASRALDPQLHTHCIVFNATYDAVEGRVKALETDEIYASAHFITAVYRNTLAEKVRALGYEIEDGRHSWRIKGLPREIESLFSKRKETIEELRKQAEAQRGTRLDNNNVALLALTSRAEKDHELTDEEFLNVQLNQLNDHQKRMLKLIKQNALGRTELLKCSLFQPEWGQSKEAIRYAMDHVFERKSVVKKDELLEAALNHSAGRATLEELREEMEGDAFIQRGDSIMTREERQREVELLAMIRSGRHTDTPLGSSIELSEQLNPQQKKAAQILLDSHSQFLFLQGKAGVGKTFTLKEMIEKATLPVILAAPTSSATDTLRNEVSGTSKTIQKILLSEAEQKNLANSLLIVDEAGLLSTKQMHSLLTLAQKQNTKILFVGDTRQHNSVEGGDALRLLQDFSIIPIAEITTITRQEEERYREAIQKLSEGKTEEGFQKLQELNAVHERDHSERPIAVAKEYVSKIKEGLSTLVVTPTWKEHETITDAIRDELKKEGFLPQSEVKILVYQSLNFTNVEKKYAPHYEVGQLVSFHSNKGPFKQGDLFEVTGRAGSDLLLKGESNQILQMNPKNYYQSFDAVKAQEKSFAVGDLILMKANYASSPKNKISNGTIKKIEKIDQDKTLHLEGGGTLDSKFRHFVHGYAITSQGSQGKTCDHVILSTDSAAGKALSKNQFYVSTSRGKRGVTLFTDNISQLKEAVQKSSKRSLVTERLTLEGIFKAKLLELKLGYEKSIEVTKEKIEKSFRKFVDRSPQLNKGRRIQKEKSKGVEIDR